MSDAALPDLDALPALGADDRLGFACHPGVPCFNACCRDLDLLLYPYDVLRLRRALGLDSPGFLSRHGRTALGRYLKDEVWR